MKFKLAVFKTIAINHISVQDDWAENVDGYVRMTKYLDCQFEELPVDQQINDELAILDKMADEIKEKASEGLNNIKRRREELLAITHQVQS